ncbi:MAG: helix-turn-helix domain-containing protein [Pseudobdellovibrionaceae bacterium]
MNLNLRIIQIRKMKSLTQTDLAGKCETTQQTIAKIEQGVVDPKLSTLQRISEALSCELVDLFYTRETFAQDVNKVAKNLKLNLEKLNAHELNYFCWEEAYIPQFHPFWKEYSIKNNKFVLSSPKEVL